MKRGNKKLKKKLFLAQLCGLYQRYICVLTFIFFNLPNKTNIKNICTSAVLLKGYV